MQSKEPLEAIDVAEIATVAAYSDRFRGSTKAKCDKSVALYPRFFKRVDAGLKNVNATAT